MTVPHPWLARLGRAGVVVALGAAVAAAGATLLPVNGAGRWYGSQRLAQWRAVTTAGQAVDEGRDQLEDVAGAVIGPVGWGLAAGLLRLAATGRLRPAGWRPPVGRWLTAVGMAAGLLALTLGVVRWGWPMPLRPEGVQYRADNRVGAAANGLTVHFFPEQLPNQMGRPILGAGQRSDDPDGFVRRAAVAVCHEASMLFACVRGGGIVFFLSAAFYCLARPHPDAPGAGG